MSIGLQEVYLVYQRVLERQLAGIALVQPDLAADFTTKPEVDEGAKKFFTRFYQRRKEIKAAEPKQAIKIALECVPSPVDFGNFTRAIDDRFVGGEFITQELAAKVEQDIATARLLRKGAASIENSALFRTIARDRGIL